MGFVGSASIGRRGLRKLPVCGGVSVTALFLDYLDDNGASVNAWYGASTAPAAVYDAGTNKVLISYQRYNYNAGTPLKENTALIYDMAARTCTVGGVIMTDDSTVVGTADSHGVGALLKDASNNWHCWGGVHGGAMKHSVSLDAGLTWSASGTLGTDLTYPHPVSVGGSIYLFARRSPGGATYPLIYYKSTAVNASTAAISWGSSVSLIDLQTDTRVYAGTFVKQGTDIYIPFTRADAADSVRKDLYIAVLDTITGNLRNLASTKTIAVASLPLTRTDADTYFRLVDQTTAGVEEMNTPCIWIDAEGVHTLYQGSAGGLTYYYARYSLAGAQLEGPTTLGTAPARYASPMIGPRPGGGVEVLFPSSTGSPNNMDNGAVFTFGGSIWRTERPAGGSWTTPALIRACTPVHPLDHVIRVEGAPADFRFAFTERAIDDLDFATAGNMRCYGWGAGGILTTPFVEDADAATYIGAAPYSAADRAVVTSAFRGFKRCGWWGVKGDLTYLMAEPVESVARKNIFGGFTLTDTAAGNAHTPYLGLKGGAASRFETGWNPTTATMRMTTSSICLGVYPSEDSQTATWDIGTTDATTPNLLLNARNASNNMVSRLGDANSTTPQKAVTSSIVLALAQRVSSGTKRIYARQSTAGTYVNGSVAYAALPNGTVQLGGSTTTYTQRRLAIAFVGAAIGDPGPLIQVVKRYMYERTGVV